MADDAHDVSLMAGLINRVAQGFTVNRQAFVERTVVRIPLPEGVVELDGVNPHQYIAQDAFARCPIVSVSIAAAEPRQRPGAQGLRPIGDGLVAAGTAQHRRGGDGQHRWQGVAPALGTAWIGDLSEECGQRLHVFGAQFHSWHSALVTWVQLAMGQQRTRIALQRLHKDSLGRLRGVAVTITGASIAAAVAHIAPVRCPVDGAGKARGIDKGFQ